MVYHQVADTGTGETLDMPDDQRLPRNRQQGFWRVVSEGRMRSPRPAARIIAVSIRTGGGVVTNNPGAAKAQVLTDLACLSTLRATVRGHHRAETCRPRAATDQTFERIASKNSWLVLVDLSLS